MGNPHYSHDLQQLDGKWDLDAVLSSRTIVITVGMSVFAELLDRPMAELLRDAIDEHGALRDGRRAIVVTDAWWLREEKLQHLPTIAIGGPTANVVSERFGPEMRVRKSIVDYREVLAGPSAAETAECVRHFISGRLGSFLDLVWH